MIRTDCLLGGVARERLVVAFCRRSESVCRAIAMVVLNVRGYEMRGVDCAAKFAGGAVGVGVGVATPG
jgi:hypothetical protein